MLRPTRARALAPTWVAVRLKPGNAGDSFWPGTRIRGNRQPTTSGGPTTVSNGCSSEDSQVARHGEEMDVRELNRPHRSWSPAFARATPIMPAHNQSLNGCRILVIEDEQFLADELDRALKDSGAKVIGPIASVSDVMKMADQGELDAAVIDVNLHDELAYGIADELSRQQIPFVFATGYDSPAFPDRYRHVTCWHTPLEPAMIVNGLVPLCERAAQKIVPIDPKG